MAHKTKPSSQRRRPGLSDTAIAIRDHNVDSGEKLRELQLIAEDADTVASAFLSELNQCASEHRALTSHHESVLALFSLDRSELNETSKGFISKAAQVRLAGRGDDIPDEITFAGDVVRCSSESRAENALASQVRRMADRNSRLEQEIDTFQKVLRTPVELIAVDSVDVVERRAEIAHIEEKASNLRRKLEALKVPSHSTLQKHYEECVVLKEQLKSTQQRLKRFEGLPPSLSEAAFKLDQVRKELNELRLELRTGNCHDLRFGMTFSM